MLAFSIQIVPRSQNSMFHTRAYVSDCSKMILFPVLLFALVTEVQLLPMSLLIRSDCMLMDPSSLFETTTATQSIRISIFKKYFKPSTNHYNERTNERTNDTTYKVAQEATFIYDRTFSLSNSQG